MSPFQWTLVLGGLPEQTWAEKTLTLALLGSRQDPAFPATPQTGRGHRETGGVTGIPAMAQGKQSVSIGSAFPTAPLHPSATPTQAALPGARLRRAQSPCLPAQITQDHIL
jgi:hypothetical protein